jgi:chemotaxis regulatin CheY-phosphate phosphatase CheZ
MKKSDTEAAQDELEKVLAIIEERGETHGDFRENFKVIAETWSGYMDRVISPSREKMMMAQLKMARDQTGDHPEHLRDALGYILLGILSQNRGDEHD